MKAALWIAGFAGFALVGAPKTAPSPATPFYTQAVDANGVTVRASSRAQKPTLEAVRLRIVRMLSSAPGLAANLKEAKLELHVISRGESITDLPEFNAFRGTLSSDGVPFAERYHGGRSFGTIVACTEENAMHDASDPYPRGYDVCTHELAHAVFLLGLDPRARERVGRRYKEALDEDKYVGTYTGINVHEFFAELSARYFGYSGGGLEASDPDTFYLLQEYYHRYTPDPMHVTEQTPLAGDALKKAHTVRGPTPSGIMVKNQSGVTLRVAELEVDGRINASFTKLIPNGAQDVHTCQDGTAVVGIDEKTKAIVAVVVGQKNFSVLTVDAKMVRAERPMSPADLARSNGPQAF